MVAEIAQESLRLQLKDENAPHAVMRINSSELVCIAVSPLKLRVQKVPSVLTGHCVLFM